MKTFTNLFVVAMVVMITISANAQKLAKFGADFGKKSVAGKELRVPYTDMVTYFGYVKPGTAPDEKRDGKNYFYLYVWVPAVAPEIGIRMISPVPEKTKIGKTDIVSPDYTANASDTKNFFDTWISLEKAEGIVSLDMVASKGATAKWNVMASNDDSGEMPAQPSGSKYNSLLRHTSEVSNPLKALTIGLYRIGFTTYKKGDVQGSFMAQLGAPVKIPGVIIAKTLAEIKK